MVDYLTYYEKWSTDIPRYCIITSVSGELPSKDGSYSIMCIIHTYIPTNYLVGIQYTAESGG
jgi:hypothetical protein